MKTLSNTLQTIINDCGLEYEENKEKKIISSEDENKYKEIHQMINEIKKLQNERNKEKKKKNSIRIVYLHTEIKTKKEKLYQFYNQVKLYFIQHLNSNNSSIFQKIENEMKQFEENEKEEKKQQRIKRNKTFHIKGLEEYNMNQIPNETEDKRIEMIQMNDNKITSQLNIIEDNVKTIQLLTQNITSQLDDQEVKIELTQEKISKNITTIDSQQQRLRDMLSKFHSPHNCCVILLLLCCIIGFFSVIASILYNLL